MLSTEAPLSQEIAFEDLNEIKTPYIPADATAQEKNIHSFLSSMGVFAVDIQGAISDHNNTQTRISPRLMQTESMFKPKLHSTLQSQPSLLKRRFE